MAMLLRRRRPLDFWPGFVDALAAILMVMVFVILIFVIGQFVLADAVSGRDDALARLHAEMDRLADTLRLEKTGRVAAEGQLGEVRASLAALTKERNTLSESLGRTTAERDTVRDEAARLAADLAALRSLKAELEAEVARLASSLDTSERQRREEGELSAQALAQVELLNRQLAAVRTQLEEVLAALAKAEEEGKVKDVRIEELGRELNLALALRAQELARYRSEFFGRLRDALGDRSDIQIVGDRFVFSSEVLFASGSDEVSPEGRQQLAALAATVKTLLTRIPGDLPWVLQVDGHTDRRPIATARFPSNWELSTARAVSIVNFLRAGGVPPNRLAATGYGEFHPIDSGAGEGSLARNRRIELKLTSR